MSTRPAARRARTRPVRRPHRRSFRRVRTGLLILPWRGKRACGVRRELNRRRVRVYHTTWTPQTAPTEPTGIVVLALVHQITRTTSTIRHDTDGTSPRSTSATYAVSSGVSFRCRQGVSFECRLTGSFRTASAPTRRQRALGNSIRSRIAPMPPAAVGHMRRLSRRRPVGRRCALPRRDVDVVHGGGREVERRLGATDARVRRASCTVAQVVVSGGPSGTRPCKRSMTSTASVSSTRSAASARLSRCSRCPCMSLCIKS